MSTTTLRDLVEESLARIRSHPFIVDAYAQQLTQEQTKRWVMCAGRESRSFPDILENLISWSTNDEVRKILQENLNDEYGNGDPNEAHFMHYVHLIDGLAIPREEFDAYNEKVGIKLALSLAYNISRFKNEGCAIGYMLINEAITPVTYGAVKNAVMRYYPDVKTDFFDLHVTVDEHHVADLYKAVDELDGQDDELRYGVEIGERGMAVLLDEAYGVFDNIEAMPSFLSISTAA